MRIREMHQLLEAASRELNSFRVTSQKLQDGSQGFQADISCLNRAVVTLAELPKIAYLTDRVAELTALQVFKEDASSPIVLRQEPGQELQNRVSAVKQITDIARTALGSAVPSIKGNRVSVKLPDGFDAHTMIRVIGDIDKVFNQPLHRAYGVRLSIVGFDTGSAWYDFHLPSASELATKVAVHAVEKLAQKILVSVGKFVAERVQLYKNEKQAEMLGIDGKLLGNMQAAHKAMLDAWLSQHAAEIAGETDPENKELVGVIRVAIYEGANLLESGTEVELALESTNPGEPLPREPLRLALSADVRALLEARTDTPQE